MRTALPAIALTVCCAASAAAQTEPASGMATEVANAPPETPVAAAIPLLPGENSDLVLAPIPMLSPELGAGLAAAAVLYYNPNKSSRPWVSGVVGGYTTKGSWGVGAAHSMSLGHDRVRVLALAGYGVANLNFYGIGPGAGEAGISVKMRDEIFGGLLDTELQLFRKGILRHLYVGGRLAYTDFKARVEVPVPGRPDLEPVAIERRSAIAMIGPAFTFDSRDSTTMPRKGAYVRGWRLYGASWLGSDFIHHRTEIAGTAFFPIGKRATLAFRKQMCGISGDAPYYDLCLFGQHADLRGYEAGRYRDGASWALQLEYRTPVAGRFGMVAFGGAGGIARDTGAIWKHSTVLAAGGVGLRYLVSRDANVNLRADVAFGKDGAAFYFGIGEAF